MGIIDELVKDDQVDQSILNSPGKDMEKYGNTWRNHSEIYILTNKHLRRLRSNIHYGCHSLICLKCNQANFQLSPD
jgi:hypothetical protein